MLSERYSALAGPRAEQGLAGTARIAREQSSKREAINGGGNDSLLGCAMRYGRGSRVCRFVQKRGALVVFAGPCRDGINERYQLFMTRLLKLRQDPISEF